VGFLDVLLGRTKPVEPDLDQLFGLPSAAITLQAAIGLTPTGAGSVCFAAIEGGAFAQVQQEVRSLLDADSQRGGTPVEFSRDSYGYSWLLSRRDPGDLPALVSDLHAVNTTLQDSDQHGRGDDRDDIDNTHGMSSLSSLRVHFLQPRSRLPQPR